MELEGGDNEFVNFILPTLKAYLEMEAHSQNVSGSKQQFVARAIGCPKIHFFHKLKISSAKKTHKDTFFHSPSPFPVIFTTATVVAFVLLYDSWLNIHCYALREAMPTQKSARK